MNNYSVKYRTKNDYSYAAQYDRFTVAQTRTYYKLVTKSDSSDGSAEFEAAVRKIYGPDCNESVLMAKNMDGNIHSVLQLPMRRRRRDINCISLV